MASKKKRTIEVSSDEELSSAASESPSIATSLLSGQDELSEEEAEQSLQTETELSLSENDDDDDDSEEEIAPIKLNQPRIKLKVNPLARTRSVAQPLSTAANAVTQQISSGNSNVKAHKELLNLMDSTGRSSRRSSNANRKVYDKARIKRKQENETAQIIDKLLNKQAKKKDQQQQVSAANNKASSSTDVQPENDQPSIKDQQKFTHSVRWISNRNGSVLAFSDKKLCIN